MCCNDIFKVCCSVIKWTCKFILLNLPSFAAIIIITFLSHYIYDSTLYASKPDFLTM